MNVEVKYALGISLFIFLLRLKSVLKYSCTLKIMRKKKEILKSCTYKLKGKKFKAKHTHRLNLVQQKN